MSNELYDGLPWKVATKTGGSGNCVEAAITDGTVYVGDTKDRSKPPHVYTIAEWDAFLDAAKHGEFDL